MDARSVVSKSNYLKVHDRKDWPQQAVIQSVNVDQVGKNKDEVLVLHFDREDLKPLMVNSTIMKAIAEIAGGSYETNNWVSKRVEIFEEKGVDSPQGKVDTLRVRAFKPKTYTSEEWSDVINALKEKPESKKILLQRIADGLIKLTPNQEKEIK